MTLVINIRGKVARQYRGNAKVNHRMESEYPLVGITLDYSPFLPFLVMSDFGDNHQTLRSIIKSIY